MQNKTFSFLTCALLMVGVFPVVAADNAPEAPKTETPKTEVKSTEAPKPVEVALPDFSDMDLSQKQTVDFPPRASLDTLEMAPLPGIYETNITGPQPMGESLSVNDSPSEQLLGRLTPDVFQEMAELERDNAYLKLQIQKEQMKKDLENLRSSYRQARLDEIAKREEVVRSRIEWWQEQEKLRLEAEAQRAEAEEIRNKQAEQEALLAKQKAEADDDISDTEDLGEPVVDTESTYELLTVKGTRGNLVARVKDNKTGESYSVRIGDSLQGEIVTSITSDQVILARASGEYIITFAGNK